MKTLICVVLDESGSMGAKKRDVIGGFNTFLADQQKLTDPCRLMMTKFNTKCWTMVDPTAIGDVKALTDDTYTPGGNTALLDAVAQTIKIAEAQKGFDERCLVLVVTDGEENSSHETTKDQVVALTKAKEALGDWTFTYLGVALDQWLKDMRYHAGNVKAYNVNAPAQSFGAMSKATANLRGSNLTADSNFYGRTDAPEPAGHTRAASVPTPDNPDSARRVGNG